MVNWYYVVGSERVGPVSVDALKLLFINGEITTETYIWKKGFQNWERLKDVTELNFNGVNPTMTEAEPEESSPEVNFTFSWNTVRENEEIFFVKIGKDRKISDNSEVYGPYSLVELKEALKEKRMNLQTLVFSPGMGAWTKIQDTPMNEAYRGMSSGISLNEVPLILVFDYSPLPLVTLVKKAGVKEGILLGAGPFNDFADKTVKASLYVGSEIKAKNVQVQIQSYDKKDQSIECHFMDLGQDAKKIMLNHAV